MPGILGGLCSALFAALCPTVLTGNKALLAHGAAQPLWQLAGLGITLAVAGAAGSVAGLLMANVDPVGQSVELGMLYDDAVYWNEGEEQEEAEHDGE